MMNPSTKSRFLRHSGGFSLIEVLVTMLIVAIGLMGLIALMVKGLQANANSTLRSIAISQAYDIADRMRGNFFGLSSYDAALPPGSTSTCSAIGGGMVQPPTQSGLNSCTTCTTCADAAAVAASDLCLWHRANAKSLPSGAGAVCKESGNRYSIFMSWDDSKSGAADKTFILRIEP